MTVQVKKSQFSLIPTSIVLADVNDTNGRTKQTNDRLLELIAF